MAVTKKRLIAGAWTLAGGAGAAKWYLDSRKYPDRVPGVQLAIQRLQTELGPVQLGSWPRQAYVDSQAGLTHGHFVVHDKEGPLRVLFAARRDKQDLEAEEDEGESGWKYYWLRPWELKKWFLDKARSLRQGSTREEDLSAWNLETLVILNRSPIASQQGANATALLGDPLGLPEYEAMCVRRDSACKDEHSRRRMHIALGISLLGTLLAGGSRVLRSMRISQSYGFVRAAVLANPSVEAVLGPSYIQSNSGTFTPTYINAKLRLVGNAGTVADVAVAASRDSVQQRWNVALARMTVGGVSCNLDLAK